MILNLSQHEAIETDAPLIVIPSGPGSGKTRVAVLRGRRLLQEKHKVVVLTFTNSAANEYRHRIGEYTETKGIHSVSEKVSVDFVGTLHSYCYRIIRRFGHLVGYGTESATLLPMSDRMAMFKEIRDRLGYKGQANEEHEAKVRREYYFTLKQNNLVDYDRILHDAFLLLASSVVQAHYICDDLIIEEAQDSAAIDWAIYRAIPAKNRFIIGDVDQAIMEFRGAYPQGFLEIAQQYQEPVVVIKLEENYRCARVICDAANRLIKHNASRYEKDTVSATGETGSIVVQGFNDAWEELTHITRLLRADPKLTVAVLYRTNYEVERSRNFMKSVGIEPFLADLRVPKPPDWRKALLLLGLASSPFNEVLAEQFLRIEYGTFVDRWKLEARATGTYLSDRIAKLEPQETLLKYLARHNISQTTLGLIEARMALMPDLFSPADLLQDLYSNEEVERRAPVGALYLGTIHSAKGREFDVVFLPAFEETKMNEQNIEEERRLAFVAVTRARSALYITYAERRTAKWGDTVECCPSRFIEEMGL